MPTDTEHGSLHVHQRQLRFPLFDPDKSILPSQLRLTNNTNDHVAFRCFPKLPADDGFIDGVLSKLKGFVPPRCTRTFLVWMEKQPPENLKAFTFDAILESCATHRDIVDADDSFLPKIREKMGGKVHEVPLMAVCHPEGERMTSEVSYFLFICYFIFALFFRD